MAYIDKRLGELIIKRVYEFVTDTNKHYGEVIKKYTELDVDPSLLIGVKEGQMGVLKTLIKEIRELEDE
nr:MAG TPA: hypothetical protein [Caudoviricetes sp.]